MRKFFVNEQEVDEGEFNAEFVAQTRAHVDDNFEDLLVEYSRNFVDNFIVGEEIFDEIDIFDMLPIEMQASIEEFVFETTYDIFWNDLDSYGNITIYVDGEEIEFEIVEIEDDEE